MPARDSKYPLARLTFTIMSRTARSTSSLVHARIGHGMMIHLACHVMLNDGARHLAEATQGIVAAKRFGPAIAHGILQPPFDALDDEQWGHHRQRADRELAHDRRRETMAQQANAVRLERCV